jgi:hypothetical protein
MKALVSSLFSKLIPKRWLPASRKKMYDVSERGRRAGKIPNYYIKYTISALRVIAWVVLVLGIISSLIWGISMGGIGGGLRIVLVVIGSFLAWLALLAARELLKLFVDVSGNTGNTADRTDATGKSRRAKFTL